jgi:hypothetical protein
MPSESHDESNHTNDLTNSVILAEMMWEEIDPIEAEIDAENEESLNKSSLVPQLSVEAIHGSTITGIMKRIIKNWLLNFFATILYT